MKLFRTASLFLAAALLAAWPGVLVSQETDLPGDPAQVEYEQGMVRLLARDEAGARTHFEAATGSEGLYSDLARLELVRMIAREDRPPGENPVPQLRQVLDAMEDEGRVPAGWLIAARGLEEAGYERASQALSLEMALRFPDHDLADDALLLAARILYRERAFSASADLLYRILDQHEDGDQIDDALIYLGRLYQAPGVHFDPYRGCQVVERFLERNDLPMIWRSEAARIRYLHCV